ncbi:crossover junction endodeoxyribonuclease RuvC [Desulfuribacillus stibiiarsenatis]|uniref:Crossover junction endodeoxyribonuclease RuvC n=1 Tax=Desulfuribacillus stibiiarsenatis TaxID=1390249 RepID=A0A1E5L360_9FIRM|nr:crossover junction endodeoxyribonuclease RuvC [Desulfuribacillus stibiiarsenatis]OEH84537.1 crossover junction endodeoxyribonuclease RuvC [Desulfuribacillus stibiiarsenatis]
MRIIGIDPGTAILGYGIIESVANKLKPIDFGCIRTESNIDMPIRLGQIYEDLTYLIDKYKPDVMAVEELFFNRNVSTALTVGQARGVVLLAGVRAGISVYEYTPLQVKQAICGYGRAEKNQVQEMVRMFLNLKVIPKPDDAADALAVSICHAHSATMLSKLAEK